MSKMTQPEWESIGEKLFGKNKMVWKFKCPVCGNVACAEDFRAYKDRGATPSSSYSECIGRYAGCEMSKPNPKPCDWAAFGLFRGPNFVVEEGTGDEVPVFEFAEEVPDEQL